MNSKLNEPMDEQVVDSGETRIELGMTVADRLTDALASQLPWKVKVPDNEFVGFSVGVERTRPAGATVSRVQIFETEVD
mgnify:CR=1 FL=1